MTWSSDRVFCGTLKTFSKWLKCSEREPFSSVLNSESRGSIQISISKNQFTFNLVGARMGNDVEGEKKNNLNLWLAVIWAIWTNETFTNMLLCDWSVICHKTNLTLQDISLLNTVDHRLTVSLSVTNHYGNVVVFCNEIDSSHKLRSKVTRPGLPDMTCL